MRASRRLSAAVVLFGIAALPRLAHASSITQFISFSGSTIDVASVAPFDPSLGTLTSVTVGITGTLSVSGVTPANLAGFIPIPYLYNVSVDQSFSGLAGQFFSFLSPATFTFSALATGAGGSFSFSSAYTYGFVFNSITDLIGFTVPLTSATGGVLVPPIPGIGGQLADFLQPVAPINQMQLVQIASALGLGGPTPVIQSLSGTALMQIDYNYTPFQPGGTSPVPEPVSLGLLGLGLAVLAVRMRKRR